MIQRILHPIRDTGLRAAAFRQFRPISSPRKRIVLVRPDHFGDLLMLGPALRFLKTRATDHELLLMTGPWNRSVAQHIAPDIGHQFWPFPGFDRQDRSTGALEPYREIGRAAEVIRSSAPEAIILFRDDHWWGAIMAREAGVPIRTGYDHKRVTPFLTHPMVIEPSHYVQQNVALARRTLAILGYNVEDATEDPEPLDWPVDDEAQDEASRLIERHALNPGFIVVHPGTGAPVKQWPIRRWAIVIDKIRRQTGLPVVLTGSDDERALCDEIVASAAMTPLNLAGETSLFTLAELFRQTSLILGVDSGPLHLATAVGTRSIHLFGPSDRLRYGPWGSQTRRRVISAGIHCPRCGDLSPDRPQGCGCMVGIGSDMVARTAIEMLADD